MRTPSWKTSLNAIVLYFVIGGCAALPFIIPPLIEFAGGMLKTAFQNHKKPYTQDLQQLMISLQQNKAGMVQQFGGGGFGQGNPEGAQQFGDGGGFGQANTQDGDPTQVYQDDGSTQATESFDPEDQTDVQQEDQTEDQVGFEQEGQEEIPPVSLDVLLVRKTIRNGAVTLLPIQDGDVLKDGRGNPQAGDKFRIMFKPHTDC